MFAFFLLLLVALSSHQTTGQPNFNPRNLVRCLPFSLGRPGISGFPTQIGIPVATRIGSVAADLVSIGIQINLAVNDNFNSTVLAELQNAYSELTQIKNNLGSLRGNIRKITSDQLQIELTRLQTAIKTYRNGNLTALVRANLVTLLLVLDSQLIDIYVNTAVAEIGLTSQNFPNQLAVLVTRLNQYNQQLSDYLNKNTGINFSVQGILQYFFSKVTNIYIEIGILSGSTRMSSQLMRSLQNIANLCEQIANQATKEDIRSKSVSQKIIKELISIRVALQTVLTETARLNQSLGTFVALLITVCVTESQLAIALLRGVNPFSL